MQFVHSAGPQSPAFRPYRHHRGACGIRRQAEVGNGVAGHLAETPGWKTSPSRITDEHNRACLCKGFEKDAHATRELCVIKQITHQHHVRGRKPHGCDIAEQEGAYHTVCLRIEAGRSHGPWVAIATVTVCAPARPAAKASNPLPVPRSITARSATVCGWSAR